MADPFDPVEFRRYRIARNLTQQDIAERIGATRTAVYSWEAGRKTPTPAFRAALADLMRDAVDVNDLEQVSAYRADRLVITFEWMTAGLDDPRLAVKLAGAWTGLSLELDNEQPLGIVWRVHERKHLGWFAVRGEAVAAALRTTFDPDNDR